MARNPKKLAEYADACRSAAEQDTKISDLRTTVICLSNAIIELCFYVDAMEKRLTGDDNDDN